MTTTFRTPCSGHCFCAGGKSASTVLFNASLEYEAGGEKRVEDVILVVPADSYIGEIMRVMDCAVRERITSMGSQYGFLRFRLDGRSGELNFWQWAQDIWFRLTYRGKPFTGSHFVPIWQ